MHGDEGGGADRDDPARTRARRCPDVRRRCHCAWRPISRKTVFSRTKAIVRQFIRSAIRDCAVCRIGALWPSSRPATTTAITPEACISSATRYAANGITKESAVSRTGSRRVLAHQRDHQEDQRSRPATPPPAASRKSSPTRHDADRRRRPTASGGAQRDQRGGVVEQRLALEDRDDPAGQPDPPADRGGRDRVRRRHDRADRERDRPGDARQQRCTTTPTPSGGEDHQPDRQQQDRPPVGVEVDQRVLWTRRRTAAAAAARTARRPRESSTSGTPGTYDAATPDQDQQERRGDVRLRGHPGAHEDAHGQAAQQGRDLHGGHCPERTCRT